MITLIRKTRVVAFIAVLMVLGTMAVAAAPASAAQKTPSIGGKLALFVYDSSSPNILPVADALVVVLDEEGNPVAKGNTDEMGRYSAALVAGQYDVTIKANGFKYHVVAVVVKGGYTTEATAPLEKEVPLGDIALFVYDNNSFSKKPIANALVSIFNPDGVIYRGYTDLDGMLYAALEGGMYTVNISAKGYKPYSFDMAVKPGYVLNYEAALDKDAALGMLTVYAWERSRSATSRTPIANATVVVYDSTLAPVAKGTTDEYGVFTVELTPDVHTVMIAAEGFMSAEARAEVKPGEDTLVEVQMTRWPSSPWFAAR
jgi:hypothetical protein